MTSADPIIAQHGASFLLPLQAARGRYCDFSGTVGPSSDPLVQKALRKVLDRSAELVPGTAEIAGRLYRTALRIPRDDQTIAYVETDESCVPLDAPKATPIQPKFVSYVAELQDRCSRTDSLTPDTNIPLKTAFIQPSFELTSAQAPEVETFEELRNYARVLIVGPPGSGKTSTIRRLALDITSDGAGQADTLPILIELRDFNPAKLTLSGISQVVDDGTSALDLAMEFEAPMSGGRLLLLLDGLDELSGHADQAMLLDRLASICEKAPHIRIVITTRGPVPEGTLKDFVLARILPFNNAQVQQWTRHYLRNHSPRSSRWAEFIDLVHYDSRFRELVSNPLLLGLASSLHWNYPEELNNFAGLLRKCIDVLIHDWDAVRGVARWRRSEVTPRQIKLLLYKVSAKLSNDLQTEFTLNDVEIAVASLTGFRESPTVLLWACRTSGLIHESGDDRYSFAHQSIAEYFAASDAVRKTEGVTRTIESSSAREDGSSYWKLACALTSDADGLLGEVIRHGTDRDERAAAFMLAQALGEEVSATVSTIENCSSTLIVALETRLQAAQPLDESAARALWPQNANRLVVWASGATADSGPDASEDFRTCARLLGLIYRGRAGTASRYLQERMANSAVPLVRQAVDALQHDGWCDYEVRETEGRAVLYLAITRSASPDVERAVPRPELHSQRRLTPTGVLTPIMPPAPVGEVERREDEPN